MRFCCDGQNKPDKFVQTIFFFIDSFEFGHKTDQIMLVMVNHLESIHSSSIHNLRSNGEQWFRVRFKEVNSVSSSEIKNEKNQVNENVAQ